MSVILIFIFIVKGRAVLRAPSVLLDEPPCSLLLDEHTVTEHVVPARSYVRAGNAVRRIVDRYDDLVPPPRPGCVGIARPHARQSIVLQPWVFLVSLVVEHYPWENVACRRLCREHHVDVGLASGVVVSAKRSTNEQYLHLQRTWVAMQLDVAGHVVASGDNAGQHIGMLTRNSYREGDRHRREPKRIVPVVPHLCPYGRRP